MVLNNSSYSKGGSPEAVVTNAYVVVDTEEEDHHVPTARIVEFDRPDLRTVSVGNSQIPEAVGLVWEDDFFDDHDDIIAVFDLDYENMISYYRSISWLTYGITLCFPNCLWMSCLLGVPCYLNENVNWSILSQHVAVTKTGICYVQEKRKTLWGCDCTDAPKKTVTVPFDRISDCSIVDPNGKTCCCIDDTLSIVHVDTSDRTVKGEHELSIVGLKNPQAFHRLVWAMRRATPSISTILDRGTSLQAAAAAATSAAANGASVTGDVATLLREIRDELRQHNAVLQTLQSSSSQASSSPHHGMDDLSSLSVPIERVEIV